MGLPIAMSRDCCGRSREQVRGVPCATTAAVLPPPLLKSMVAPVDSSPAQDRAARLCEDCSEAQTAFRRWLSPGSGEGAQEVVPGLRQALAVAGLTSYAAALEAWCEEVGAAFLAEVQEDLEDACEGLGLSAPKRRQLRRLLLQASGQDTCLFFD